MSIVTVTTTTMAFATTVGTVVAFGAIGTCILITALIGKELSTSYDDEYPKPAIKERLKSLIGSLNIVITPMLMIFALIVTVEVLEVLAT